jgi:hypothetical protein
MRALPAVYVIFAASLFVRTALADEASETHLALFNRMLTGTHCETVPTNGLNCKYKLGTVEVSIGNIGDASPVIAFNHSDSKEEFYAVMVSGCVAIIHTRAEMAKHERNYGVFISPVTGKVYMTPGECSQAAKGS